MRFDHSYNALQQLECVFLLDMAACVCHDNVQMNSIYIYKTRWSTLPSTINLPFPQKPNLSQRNKNDLHFEQRTCRQCDRPTTTKPSFIQNCDAQGPNSTQCYILEGIRSASVLCTTLPVRISSFPLECSTLVTGFLDTEVMEIL